MDYFSSNIGLLEFMAHYVPFLAVGVLLGLMLYFQQR